MKRKFLLAFLFLSMIPPLACRDAALDNPTFLNAVSGGEDNSASAAAASAVGGTLAASDINGKVTFRQENFQLAEVACPTLKTGAGFGCTQNGVSVDLTYAGCNFSPVATWTGTLAVALSQGFLVTTITCGTFPDVTTLASGQSIQRQFVTAANPSWATRHSTLEDVIVDHATANLGIFDTGVIIPASLGTGYGTEVFFDGTGKRNQMTINEHVSSANFDHSITGTLALVDTGTSRSVSSATPLTVYHNLLRVVGKSTFNNVTYTDLCCLPTSGSISTLFSAGNNVAPTAAGSAFVGKTETLQFNGCGSGIYRDVSGATKAVSLTRCY